MFAAAAAVALRPDFLSQLDLGATVAQAINTEKARSEFIIAPILLELRRLVGGRLGHSEPVGGQVERAAVEADVNGACQCGELCHDVTLRSRNRTSWLRATPARVPAAFIPPVNGEGGRIRTD